MWCFRIIHAICETYCIEYSMIFVKWVELSKIRARYLKPTKSITLRILWSVSNVCERYLKANKSSTVWSVWSGWVWLSNICARDIWSLVKRVCYDFVKWVKCGLTDFFGCKALRALTYGRWRVLDCWLQWKNSWKFWKYASAVVPVPHSTTKHQCLDPIKKMKKKIKIKWNGKLQCSLVNPPTGVSTQEQKITAQTKWFIFLWNWRMGYELCNVVWEFQNTCQTHWQHFVFLKYTPG